MTIIYKEMPDIFSITEQAERIENDDASAPYRDYAVSPAMTFNDAVTIGKQGGYWPDGAKDMQPVELPLDSITAGDMTLPRVEAAVVGNRVNVPAMLCGSPVSMYRIHQSHVTKRLIRVGIDIGGYWGTTSEQLFNRGSAVLSLIDTLNAAGFSVEVTAVSTFCTGVHDLIYQTVIKEAGASWSADSFAFTLANDTFWRRFCWHQVADMAAHGNREEKKAARYIRDSGLGNGMTGEALKLPERFDVFFSYLTHDTAGNYDTIESALETARDTADKALQKLN